MPLLLDELITIYIPQVKLAVLVTLSLSKLILISNQSSYSSTIQGQITSILSISVYQYIQAIFYSRDVNLQSILVQNLKSRFVLYSVQRSTYSLVALFKYRSRTNYILTSASLITIATIQKAPIIAYAPILYTLFITVIAEPLRAYI